MYEFIWPLFAGISIGIVIGHWAAKQEKDLEYERGKLDGINTLWPYLTDAWAKEIAAQFRGDGKRQAVGGNSGDQQAV